MILVIVMLYKLEVDVFVAVILVYFLNGFLEGGAKPFFVWVGRFVFG